MTFSFDEENSTNGILYWLFTHHQNVYKKHTNSPSPSIVVYFNNDTYWITSCKSESEHYQVYFPYYLIKIEGYLIETCKANYATGYHPKQWFFESSIDNHEYLIMEYAIILSYIIYSLVTQV